MPAFAQVTTRGVMIESGDVFLVGNDISVEAGGRAISISSAVNVVAANNIISAYDDEVSSAVVSFAPIVLIGNTLIARSGESSGAKIFSTATLFNNIIDLGPGNITNGLIVDQYSDVTLLANDFYLQGRLKRFVYNSYEYSIFTLSALNACNWENCSEAGLNIAFDPLFVSDDDPHLTAASPCIDAGVDPHEWYDGEEVEIDYDGDTRPYGAGWDIGADEWTAAQ